MTGSEVVVDGGVSPSPDRRPLRPWWARRPRTRSRGPPCPDPARSTRTTSSTAPGRPSPRRFRRHVPRHPPRGHGAGPAEPVQRLRRQEGTVHAGVPQRHGRGGRGRRVRPHGEDSPITRIRRQLVKVAVEHGEAKAAPSLFTKAAVELSSHDPEVASAVATAFDVMSRHYAACIAEAQGAGEIDAAPTRTPWEPTSAPSSRACPPSEEPASPGRRCSTSAHEPDRGPGHRPRARAPRHGRGRLVLREGPRVDYGCAHRPVRPAGEREDVPRPRPRRRRPRRPRPARHGRAGARRRRRRNPPRRPVGHHVARQWRRPAAAGAPRRRRRREPAAGHARAVVGRGPQCRDALARRRGGLRRPGTAPAARRGAGGRHPRPPRTHVADVERLEFTPWTTDDGRVRVDLAELSPAAAAAAVLPGGSPPGRCRPRGRRRSRPPPLPGVPRRCRRSSSRAPHGPREGGSADRGEQQAVAAFAGDHDVERSNPSYCIPIFSSTRRDPEFSGRHVASTRARPARVRANPSTASAASVVMPCPHRSRRRTYPISPRAFSCSGR